MSNPYTDPVLKRCWQNGYDKAVNGANKRNCSFSNFDFHGPKDKAWLAGRTAGEAAIKNN